MFDLKNLKNQLQTAGIRVKSDAEIRLEKATEEKRRKALEEAAKVTKLNFPKPAAPAQKNAAEKHRSSHAPRNSERTRTEKTEGRSAGANGSKTENRAPRTEDRRKTEPRRDGAKANANANTRRPEPRVKPAAKPKMRDFAYETAADEEKEEKADYELAVEPFLELPPELPVSEKEDEIARAIKENQVVIVSGETGSGKTTQLPKICLKIGLGTKGLIGHTQPRRIAATSIAKRLAQETKTEVGQLAGYKIRFADRLEKTAKIKLMTDGILLAETQSDPLLKQYDTIIIDEAHERSLNIDFLIGYLRQILLKRKDLKVIITSATIDSKRFAKHFEAVNGKEVPVINVSGRLYPVQIKYSPVEEEDEDDDRTLVEAIADAVEDLFLHGPGDVLVFLPGEREIREVSDYLVGRKLRGTEILPLFSRLSIAEQDRIFQPGGNRRVILSTNVAETSLTVPGIRYVVDTGLARVKRYSYRNKVEQLQIEKVSQAAANQRAGRCGRVANGICIRLYSEEDFKRRDAYTDPEILRSSLATVILKMKSLRFADISRFPFIDAPLPKAIADGYDTLIELNAVEERGGALTEIGRKLARLPLDAKVGRMLLAANDNNALEEMLIIVSALSVQDPRERPLDAQQQADTAHRKFSDEKSEFLSWIKLWNFMQDRIANKASNRLLEQEFLRNYLSPRRLREWRDVHKQLRETVKELDFRFNTAPATYEEVHLALLTGLLGSLGMRVLDADYRSPPFAGARGIKFWPWPGSFIAKKAGKWIVAAELVETTKLFARTIANIEPEWIERVGRHLIKKSWSDPHWEKSNGGVVAFEKGTLYGLPVYGQRRVNYAPIDPKLSRELFIKEALVAGAMESNAPFWQHNSALIRQVEELEHKSRRPDVLISDDVLYDFYNKKLDESVVSVAALDKWRRENEAANPKILYLSKEDLMRHDADGITIEYFPKTMEVGGMKLALTYHFEPGAPRDGVTLSVPVYLLNQIDEKKMEWLVPGMVKEKVAALLKTLPQKFRRHFVPLPEWGAKFAEKHEKPEGVLLDVIREEAAAEFRIDIKASDFKLEAVAPHLFLNYKVIDEHGRQLDMSRNLAQLRSEWGIKAREAFQEIASANVPTGDDAFERMEDWSCGELPDIMEIRRKGMSLIGHPAVVSHGDYCSVEVFDDPQEAERETRAGVRNLVKLILKEQVKYVRRILEDLQMAYVQASSIPPLTRAFKDYEELKEAVLDLALNQIMRERDLPNNKESFDALCQQAKNKLSLLAQEIARLINSVVAAAAQTHKKVKQAKVPDSVIADINGQVSRMFPANFLASVDYAYLKHYPRYLKAIEVRLEKYRSNPDRDAANMAEIEKFTKLYIRAVSDRKGVRDEQLDAFGNAIDELRVSLFAQELRTPFPVSVKRLQKMWQLMQR